MRIVERGENKEREPIGGRNITQRNVRNNKIVVGSKSSEECVIAIVRKRERERERERAD